MHTCPWWFTWTFDNPLRRLVHDAHKMLEPYVVPGSRVADVGCGMGYFTVELARIRGAGGKRAGRGHAAAAAPRGRAALPARGRRGTGAVHRSDGRVARTDRARRLRAGVLDGPRGWRPRRLLRSAAGRDRARRPRARGRADVPRLARAGRGGAARWPRRTASTARCGTASSASAGPSNSSACRTRGRDRLIRFGSIYLTPGLFK